MVTLNSFSTLLLIVPLLLGTPQSDEKTGKPSDKDPQLQADLYEFNFGEVEPGRVLERTFVLENKGTTALKITRLNTTADQLKADLVDAKGKVVMTVDQPKGEQLLKAGEKISLKVVLDTRTLTGNVRKRVLVYSDDAMRDVLSIAVAAKLKGTTNPAQAVPPDAAQNQNRDPNLEGLTEEDLKGPPPKLEMSEYEVDFGDAVQGEMLTRTLKIKNSGEGPLKIVKLQSSCGCTVPRMITKEGEVKQNELNAGKKIILNPGDEASLDIEFNSKSMVGEIKREVKVFSNDRTKNPLVIPVKARAQKAYELNPEALKFGDVMRRHKTTLGAKLLVARVPSFEIVSADTPAPYITVSWKREAMPVPGAGNGGGGGGGGSSPDGAPQEGGGTAASGPVMYAIEVTVTEEAPLGTLMRPVVLHTNFEKAKEISLPLMLRVTSEVSFNTGDPSTPDKLDFGLIEADKDAVRELEIVNENRSVPYRPSKIEILGKFADNVKQELITLEDGMKYRLKITIKPGIDARYFRGILRLTSDHPDLPTKDIAFGGWMNPRK